MVDNLISCDFNTDYIFSHSGISATLTGSFATPAPSIYAVALDDNNNLISMSDNTTHIYTHSGISATLTGSFATPGGAPDGLDVYDGNLISCDTGQVHIYQHSGISATLTGSIVGPGGVDPCAVVVDDNGNLISADYGRNHIYTHSGISTTLTGSFSSPASNVDGLELDNGNLISCDWLTGYIYTHSGISPTMIGSFVSPAGDPDGVAIQIPLGPPGAHIIDEDDTVDVSDAGLTNVHIQVAQVHTIAFGIETVNISDSYDFNLSELAETFTLSLPADPKEDIYTITESLSITLVEVAEVKTISVSDTVTISEPSIAITGGSVTYEGILTKVEIGGTEFNDYQNLRVSKSISDYNSSSDYTVRYDSPFGRHDDDFTVGDEIIIYVDENELPTTILLKGVVERIKFIGKGAQQKVELRGRDYSMRLQDITVEPVVYTDSEISTIVTNIIDNSIDDITTNNVDVTGTTLKRIAFNQNSVFDALTELAKLAGFIFYVDNDKDLHFERRENISSGIVLDNTNIVSTVFNTTREGMANSIWVYGDRYLSGFKEANTLVGSPWGGGKGSIFVLTYKPHNTLIEYLGVPQKGGIFGMVVTATSGPDYLVDYEDKEIIFQSGTDIGYDAIPVSGGSVLSTYERDIPIVKFGEDKVSIKAYGKKVKIINDKTIKDPETAIDLLQKELEGADPFRGMEIQMKGWDHVIPGNTVNVTLSQFGISNVDVGILSVDYVFDKNTVNSKKIIKFRLDKKVIDITDEITDLRKRLNLIEAQDRQDTDVITRLEQSTGSALVVGSHWDVSTRTQTGSTLYLSDSNKVFASGLASGTKQNVLAGSGTSIGSPYGALTLQFSGGYAY